ncbi:MAG TPA: DNA primase [Candidatus Udaeobacter sp.]
MGTIPTEAIEQIAAANDIVEVIGSYFPLKRAGANFKALCPFHQEKTPSFHVSPQRQTFHCFGCGVGGSVFRFVMDYEHIDFPAAVRKLAARVGIPVVEKGGAMIDEDRERAGRRRLLQLHAEAAEWFHGNLIKREFARPARKYLKERGITAEVAKRWQIGYAPDEWDAFGRWARDRGYDPRDLVASGLVKTKDDAADAPSRSAYDRFRGRIMFPICNDISEVIAFSGRLLKDEEGAAKYLNSPETPLFQKGRVLFGLHKSKRALIEANCAIVCEGQLDLISLFEAGIKNVVAPQGTAFTERQAKVLKRYVNEIVLCYDSDTAGQKAAHRSLSPLLRLIVDKAWWEAFANNLYLRIAEMPPGKDPDVLIREEGAESFRERITKAPDFFDYWIDRAIHETDLSSLKAKLDLAGSLAETVSEIHDPIFRGQVAHNVASRLAIPVDEFNSLIKKPAIAQSPTQPEYVEVVRGHDIAMLCLLALRDEAARNFLLEQNWREVLAQTPGAEFLVRVLDANIRLEDAASLNAFMAILSPQEEGLVSAWLMQKMPPNAKAVVEDWWNGLRQASLRRQLEIAEGRMKLPGLSTGDVVNLQKEILDLQEQLHELSPARKADS